MLCTPELAEFAPEGTPIEPAGMITVAGLHDPVEVVRVGAAAERARRPRLTRTRAGRKYRSRMTTYETIEFERAGSVGWLRLNRPDKLNSFTVEMWHEMRALGRRDPGRSRICARSS